MKSFLFNNKLFIYKNRVIAFSLAAALSIVINFFYFIRPAIASYQSKNQSYHAFQQDLTTIKNNKTLLLELNKALKTDSKTYPKYLKASKSKHTKYKLIHTITKQISEAGLQLSQISPTNSHAFKIIIKGNYFNLITLLKTWAIQTTPIFIDKANLLEQNYELTLVIKYE